MSENNTADKLVGVQYLDLQKLEKNVKEANRQLSTIGKNIKFDFSQQIADEITKSVNKAIKDMNIKLPSSGSKKSGGKSQLSDLEKLEREQIKAYSTLTRLKKSMLSTEDSASVEQLRKGIESIEQQIQKNEILLSQKRTEVEYDKVLATTTEARLKHEKEIANAQKKASVNPETEILKILKDQQKIENEIYQIDKLMISASEEEKVSQNARKEVLTRINADLEASKNKILEENSELKDNEKVQAEINKNLEREIGHRQEIARRTKQQEDQEKARSKATEQIKKTLTTLVTVYAANALKKFWKDSIDYGQKYYDLLTEIRIVSGASEEEALRMGESYRRMAQEMSVSSTEIASAAVEFWRQGLDDSEVNARLKDTTQYAKISGLAFEEAAKLVTAATNSMDLDSQRVVDVFSYLGDASASGADEIGTAMQKASASAQEAGITFEWLGAYIATVSEKTRQAPESIGNAFNSMMSRLQSIKQMGYNEEDETRINDVAKALNSVNIQLMGQDGEWRNMSDIFMDVALKWGTMDDKARAYLATTMAGTRQKNVFLTLMNDMSKINSKTGEASRAMELYEGAINSAGAATEKYAIWSESVAAAQGRMKAAFEEVYSLLNADWLKGFYDGLANIASGFAEVTDSVHGLNVIIPVVAVGLFSLIKNVAALGGISGVVSAITASFASFGSVVPIAMAAGVAGQTVLCSAFFDAETDINESLDSVSESLDSINTSHEQMEVASRNIETLRERYIELSTDTDLTKQEQEELDEILDEIARISPDLANAVDGVTSRYSYQASVVAALNDELREKQRLQAAEARDTARGTFSSLVETGETIKEKRASNSERSELVNEFLNARKGNEGTDQQTFIQDYAKNYVQQLMDKQGEMTDEDARVRVRNHLETVTGEVYRNTKQSKMAEQFANWLNENWVSVQDEATTLSGQEAQWKQQIHDVLMLWADLGEFRTEQFRQLGEQAANEIISGFDYNGDIESQLHNFTGKIMERTNELLLEETEAKGDTSKSSLLNQLDAAYSEAMEKKTKESIDAYNELVRQWNSQEGSTHFKELTEDLIAVADASEDAKDGVTELTKAEKYAETTRKRQELKDARTSGFTDYLNELSTSLGPDGTDMTSYKAKLNEICENNEELYRALLDTYPDLAKIENGTIAGADAAQAIKTLMEQADATAEYWQQYYDAAAQIPTGDSGEAKTAQEMLLAMKEALLAGGEKDGYGVVAALDLLSTFGEGAIDVLSEVIPGIETLTEDTISYQELLHLINESLVGTYENAVSFINELATMDSLSEEGLIGSMTQLQEILSTEEGQANFRRAWAETDESVKDNIKSMYGDSEELFELIEDEGKDVEDVFKDVNKHLKKIELDNLIELGQIWKEVGDIAETNVNNAEELYSAYGTFEKKIDDLSNAQSSLNYLMDTGNFTTEEGVEALNTLSEVCGRTISSESDLAYAQQFLANQMNVASNSSEWLLNYLYGICGTDFDASNWQSQLSALGASGNAAANIMLALMQTLQSIHGTTVSFNNGRFNVNGLGPTSFNIPSSTPRSTGSGGGGSGGDNDSGTSKELSEAEKMLEIMKQIQDIRKHQMDMIAETRGYYEDQGYLTTAIKYYEDEKKALESNNKTLESNVSKIEKLMKAKQKEIKTMSTSDERYEQLVSDLEALQSAHQEYSLELLQNKRSLEEFNEAIKELEDEIRDMEIELRETILEAIEDREELEERMLEGRIDMENEILDVITKRYEKERDLAIETAEAKIEALEKEKDLLDEQLEARKKLAEKEDKQLKLAQLQAQLNRISADPTRRKEALELQKQIAELRDEMAWDLAEEEVEAQKESIDQQIGSLEEYIEYVEGYYEDLFEHPQKLIAEMQAIISKTDVEILEFLKTNNEEYQNATDATREHMEKGWQETLDDMRGVTRTHWDEVEEIIKGGDEAIINFLKENSKKYKEAGKLQAEKYVDEWTKQLDNLKKAYQDFYKQVNESEYSVNLPYTGGSSSGSPGGGTGAGGNSQGSYRIIDSYGNAMDGRFSSLEEAKASLKRLQSSTNPTYVAKFANAYVTKFKKGGMADFTGPAWLDGTKSAPERILSPYQTQLFEDMIATLHQIKVTVPSMPSNVYSGGDANSYGSTFGDINISVEKLSSDEDYHEMARRVMEEISSMMSRGSVVGGIRITR